MASLSLNVGNFVTLKLSSSNYPLWREQVMSLAESQDLLHHLTKELPTPTKYHTSESTSTTDGINSTTLTKEFIDWRRSDRLLRGWIIGTLSEEALGLVVRLDTASAVWDTLKDAYAQDSQEREFTLHQQLTYLRKDDTKTISDHIRLFKGLCDNLATIGKPVPDQDKIFYLLTSLGPQYDSFITTMLKPPRPTYSELISQLQNLDLRQNWFSTQSGPSSSPLTPHLAFYGQQQKQSRPSSFTSAGRGFHAQQSHNHSQRDSSTSTQSQRNHHLLGNDA